MKQKKQKNFWEHGCKFMQPQLIFTAKNLTGKLLLAWKIRRVTPE